MIFVVEMGKIESPAIGFDTEDVRTKVFPTRIEPPRELFGVDTGTATQARGGTTTGPSGFVGAMPFTALVVCSLRRATSASKRQNMLGNLRLSRRKSVLANTNSSENSIAMVLAFRGSSLMSAISPKNVPPRSVARTTGSPATSM